MSISKQDLTLITTPFLLTAILIVVGYQILISSTPEAKVVLPKEQTTITILTESSFPTNGSINPEPAVPKLLIRSLPQNDEALKTLLETAKSKPVNTIYISLPVVVNADHSLKLSDADQSSPENVLRWLKKTVSTAHKYGYHTMVALTLNASSTINDFGAFSKNYLELLNSITPIASEYNISFFNPGLTIGHPLYSNLPAKDITSLYRSTETTIRKKYAGKLVVNLCCSQTSTFNPGGFSLIDIIPTPEYSVPDLMPQAQAIQKLSKARVILRYDRDAGMILPALSP